jgi:hypothetical protein
MEKGAEIKDFPLIKSETKEKKDMETEKFLSTMSFVCVFPDPSMPVNTQSILSSSVHLLLYFLTNYLPLLQQPLHT